MKLRVAAIFLVAFLHLICAEEAQDPPPEADDPAHKYTEHAQHQHKDPSMSEEGHYTEGEDGEEEHNPEFDHNNFLGDEDKEEFKSLSPEEAKEKLKTLFPKIDENGDKEVTLDELTAYVKKVFKGKVLSGLDLDIEEKDTDKDGKVSWEEFIKGSFGVEDEKDYLKDQDDDVKKSIERDRKRFTTADADGDDKLERQEYIHFLHPESTEKMSSLHVEETMEDLDKDKDGFLTLEEFLGDYKPEEETEKGKENPPEWVAEEEKRFKEDYDMDQDGRLDREELKKWIVPETEDNIAANEAKHLIESSDDNKDDKLDVEEMVNHHDVFVSSEVTDFGKSFGHDEL